MSVCPDDGVWRFARLLPSSIVIDVVENARSLGWSIVGEPRPYEDNPAWMYLDFIQLADPDNRDVPPPVPEIDMSPFYTPINSFDTAPMAA